MLYINKQYINNSVYCIYWYICSLVYTIYTIYTIVYYIYNSVLCTIVYNNMDTHTTQYKTTYKQQ